MFTSFGTLMGAQACAFAFYDWKAALKTVGWSVLGSGDGFANYSAVGDVITNRVATGVPAANDLNDLGWVRIGNPAGVEICCQMIVGANGAGTVGSWRAKISPSAGFVGGVPDFETMPTATDEYVFCGPPLSGGRSIWNGGSSSGLSTQNCVFLGMAEDVFPYRFWFAHVQCGDGVSVTQFLTRGGWLYDRVDLFPTPPLPADVFPMVIYLDNNQGSALSPFTAQEGGIGAWGGAVSVNTIGPGTRPATSGAPVRCRIGAPGNANSNLNTSPLIANAHDLFNFCAYTDDSGDTGLPDAIKGTLSMALCSFQPLSGGNTFGTTYTVDGVDDAWVRINQAVLPWDGSTPIATGPNSWSDQRPAIIWNALTDPIFRGGNGVLTYRMRATDTTLARTVFWSAPKVDTAGDFYTGPGPLVGVITSNIFTSRMI